MNFYCNYMEEKIVEVKICKHCGSKFEITDKDLEFYDKISPIFAGKKYLIPTPTLCPDCRQQRRLSFRNERKLYKRKCDLTGKEIISIYSPDKPYKVYDQKEWWSDKWDALDYGMDFDFNKGFFEQFSKLLNNVPKIALNNSQSEGSDYCNDARFNKNCYLLFCADNSEDSAYSWNVRKIRNTFDGNNIEETNLCYECIDDDTIYSCFYCQECINCRNCYFSINCLNCSNCLFCYGLVNANYMINNIQYTKEEFEKILENTFNGSYIINKKSKSDLEILKSHRIVKNLNMINCENSNGDFLYNCKNTFYSFNIDNSNNIKYVWFSAELNDSYDLHICGRKGSFLYEDIGCWGDNYKLFFSTDCRDCSNLIYSDNCFNSSNLFGCIGLKNKEYCILNKQYTREEYEKLVPKIIEHMMTSPQPSPLKGEGVSPEWGEFFPSWMSPFGYNETVAIEYYPIDPPSNLEKIPHPNPLLRGEGVGFNWSFYEPPFPKVEKIIPANKLPDNIADIPDDILNWAIECEVTKKPFRIIAQELEFYRKHNLPIPRRHPDQRHLDRMALRNPRKLFDRKCDKCGKEIKTTYSPERPEIVYCEECYNKEIY